jgi:ATP-binding cassette, subfamily B, bacterial MsbA
MFDLSLDWRKPIILFIYRMARLHVGLIGIIVVFTLLAGLLEGGSMGVLVIIARVLTDDAGLEGLQEFGQLGQLLQQFSTPESSNYLVLGLIFVVVFGQLLKSLAQYTAKRVTVNLKVLLRKAMEERVIQKIMALRYEDVMRYPPGELTLYVSIAAVVGRMVVSVTTLMFDVVMLIAYLAVMIVISTQMTLLVLISLVLLSGFFSIVVKKIRQLSDIEVQASIDQMALSVQMLNNPRMLRVLGATRQAAIDIATYRNKALDVNKEREIVNLMVAPIVDFIVLSGAATILLTAYYIADGHQDEVLTQAVLFIVILNRMFPRVKGVNSFRLAVAESIPQFKKIAYFLEEIPVTDGQEGLLDKASIHTIKFEDVGFRHLGAAKEILRKVSFRIPSGTTTAIVGLSGAGKSTIADLIIGLVEPSEGQILIDHQSLSQIDHQVWGAKVGVVDQTSGLLNMSIGDNVTYPLKLVGIDSIIPACQAANIHEFISGLDAGYSTMVGEGGYRLSAGQRQRLILARALFRRPAILILDEATNALDAKSEEMIIESVGQLHGKCTVIVITHQLRLLRQSDQVLFLENGDVTSKGTFNDLLKNSRGFRDLWEKQIG